jgi:hypothetical protein
LVSPNPEADAISIFALAGTTTGTRQANLGDRESVGRRWCALPGRRHPHAIENYDNPLHLRWAHPNPGQGIGPAKVISV